MAVRVVIADDEDAPRKFAARILKWNGYDVVGTAMNGQEAIDLCAQLRPDIVLLDLSMPIVTGNEAAERILAAGTATHVCVASSVNMNHTFDHLRSLGCHTVTKPYRDATLLAELQAIHVRAS